MPRLATHDISTVSLWWEGRILEKAGHSKSVAGIVIPQFIFWSARHVCDFLDNYSLDVTPVWSRELHKEAFSEVKNQAKQVYLEMKRLQQPSNQSKSLFEKRFIKDSVDALWPDNRSKALKCSWDTHLIEGHVASCQHSAVQPSHYSCWWGISKQFISLCPSAH